MKKKKTHTLKPLLVYLLCQYILRKKAKPVSKKDIGSKRIKNLFNRMVATCEKELGVGLAAPQIGVSEQLFVIYQRPTKRRPDLPVFGPEAIINPKIIGVSKKIKKAYEGCLSIPGILGNTPRYVEILVEYTNLEGDRVTMELKDFLARVFQHEYDHLHGTVYLDRITGKDIITEKEYMKLITKK